MTQRLGLVLSALLATGLAAQAAPHGWKHYTDAMLGYTIAYPPGWSIDTHYVSAALGPDREIHGVAFTIPAGTAAGTNLGTDSKLSVESLPGSGCQPSQFVDPADDVHRVHADGRIYTAATSEDAGAGNRYETQIFVIDGTSPCVAVRYFIHSAAIGNFDPGTVKAFDRAGLLAAFDRIRATLTLGK
ncbi:MAG: hypothetical protein WDM91_05320 [Rhizomicrobium sp.]